jgi:hypothetical protein
MSQPNEEEWKPPYRLCDFPVSPEARTVGRSIVRKLSQAIEDRAVMRRQRKIKRESLEDILVLSRDRLQQVADGLITKSEALEAIKYY